MTILTRDEIESRRLTLSQSVLEEIETARRNGELPEPYTQKKCHVCCEVESKNLVNTLIGKGCTNREITECCDGINARRRDKGDKRTISAYSVRCHRRFHFDVQRPVLSAYRKIVERRAEEINLDHLNGIGHVVTALAVLETVMYKGYENLIEEETQVGVRDTIDAAARLHDITYKDADQRKMADLLFTMDRIVRAAQEFVPAERQADFLARVEGHSRLIEPAAEVVAVREFHPLTPPEEDDN